MSLLVKQFMQRMVLSKEDADLNVMRMIITKDEEQKWHYNRLRDEVIILFRGMLRIDREYGGSVELRSAGDLIYIESGEIHRLVCLTDDCEFLEVIGGKFFQGACVYVEPSL